MKARLMMNMSGIYPQFKDLLFARKEYRTFLFVSRVLRTGASPQIINLCFQKTNLLFGGTSHFVGPSL